jgi:uncharacterized membrane protein
MKNIFKKQDKQPSTPDLQGKRFKRSYLCIAAVVAFCIVLSPVALADDSPLDTINNLSDFIFSVIRAIGLILLGFGIVQIGLSLKSHDASQRANGFMTFFGGVVITFAKEILNMIIQ